MTQHMSSNLLIFSIGAVLLPLSLKSSLCYIWLIWLSSAALYALVLTDCSLTSYITVFA